MPTNTTTLAILKDGTPIRIHLFENPAFDVDGFLIQFTKPGTQPETYRYHQHSEFKREDRKKPDLTGYYNESLFLKYIQNIEPVPTLDKLIKHDFKNNLAFEGEEITVSTIDFDSPYDYFYNTKNYTFNLELSLDKKGVANYRKLIMENYRIVDSKINTDGQVPVVVLNNQSTTAGGYFFKKNLGNFINNWTISDIQKSTFKRIMSLIVFKIREINRDIIPIIATNTHFFDKEFDVANGIIDYNDTTSGGRLTDLEKLLFDLKRGWGYYYSPLNAEDFPLREDFDEHLTSLSSYEDYFTYLSNLENFYSKCYSTKNLAFYKSDEKLEYLLEILPPSALSLLPFKLILETIKKYLKINLSQEDQRLLVRLVISVTKSHANEFLDFLLEKEDGAKTNFQTIYEALTDARLERYSFVNWFVNEQPNRKYFAFAIYELWKVSKFNLGYISPGTNPIHVSNNFQGVDPKNYFVNNKQEYNTSNILTFSSSRSDFTTRETFFESAINNRRIDIKKIETEDSALYHIHNKIPTLFGSFHLFQEISFSGLEANLDLMIPKTATVPAFLFHFIEEYDRLADFDAGVSLAIDLTADILLMYFTGGASVLRDLQYLKYTNNIGKALQGSLSATEAVEVWRGLEVGSEIFTVTTGELAHINQYLIATENNEKKKKILEKNQKVLLTLMMAGVGSSVTARSKAVQEADETLRLIADLPENIPHNIPQPMIDVLTTLSGQKAVTLTLYGNKLNTLNLGGVANTIAAKYNMIFTDVQKLKFWNDFQHIEDPAFWKLLNSGKDANGAINGSFIDNWISLSERGLQEAKITDYICVQRRTDALINYVDEPITKPIINTLSYERKLVFIDTFGNDLATFKNKPELINQWKRYYDDLVLRNTFTSLSNSRQIAWLEKYGDLSPDLYTKYLKANPNTIFSWSRYSNEIDLINEIYKFTKEEQLLFYKNFISLTEKEIQILHREWLSFNNVSKLSIIENADIWIRYVKIRDYLSEKNYIKIAEIFNKKIIEGISPQGFSNIKYIDLGDDITRTIEIANRTDDIAIIHSNFPEISIDILQRAKNHYYKDNQLFFDGEKFIIGRFARQEVENDEWMDAIGDGFGTLLSTDEKVKFKWLIAHEYIESRLVEKGIPFRSYIAPGNFRSYDTGAHWLSPARNGATGEIFYQEFGLIASPPLPDLINFNNLEEIIDFYVNLKNL